MRITFFSAHNYDQQAFKHIQQLHFSKLDLQFSFFSSILDQTTVSLAKGSEVICVFVNDCLDAQLLQQLVDIGVKAILLRCAGFNHIDLAIADQLGLFVARVPNYSPEAVAEHTLALVMTLNRATHHAYNRILTGNFSLDNLVGETLHGKTFALIGTGKIGLATARIFYGLGCRVIGYDTFKTPTFAQFGQYVPLPQLFAEADLLSLHCPLVNETQHLINNHTINQMKKGVILINTSRGALIDTQAVIEGLKSQQIGGLALDVYEYEKHLFFRDLSKEGISDELLMRLLAFPNVLMSGHQGFLTHQALNEIAFCTLQNLQDFISQMPCINQLQVFAEY